MTVIPTVVAALGTVQKKFGMEIGGIGVQRMNREHPDYCVAKIS